MNKAQSITELRKQNANQRENGRRCAGCDRVHEGPATADYTKWNLRQYAVNQFQFYCPQHYTPMTAEELHALSHAAEILQAHGQRGYEELADEVITVISENVGAAKMKVMPRAMVNRNRKGAGLEPLTYQDDETGDEVDDE